VPVSRHCDNYQLVRGGGNITRRKTLYVTTRLRRSRTGLPEPVTSNRGEVRFDVMKLQICCCHRLQQLDDLCCIWVTEVCKS
jgi:hypothetical protein